MATKTKPCTGCQKPVEPLEEFPGGKCLECHAAITPFPTAEQVVALWGGPAAPTVINFD